jgi:dihydropyrimidine dehydrogenase (NAD+) subunit PreA
MADLSIDMCGIKSPNPFWLASAPPANTGEQIMRAFDAGWGGAVWKTLGNPIVNVSSRFGAVDYAGSKMIGFNNIELITDRPLATNLKEITEVKKKYPDHAVIASIMVDTKDEWRDIIRMCEDTGADGLELNFGCPHGMCERGMGSAVSAEPDVLEEIAGWARSFTKMPILTKLSPNVSEMITPAHAAVRAGTDGLSLINTVKSVIGVDLDSLHIKPTVGDSSTNGGYCGPAVKPIALYFMSQLARDPDVRVPISGIGGISDWKDAAEFIALGATSVQVCTAVMHYGYRIVEDMIDGLSEYLDSKGMKSVNELRGLAVDGYKDWGQLDLNYNVVAKIDQDKCIGCQLCYTACRDGAHQCIHVKETDCTAWHGASDHGEAPRIQVEKAVFHSTSEGAGNSRVPFIDEKECIGCNLCALVCPVEDCITMEEVKNDLPKETWTDRINNGTNVIHGGINESL